MIVVEGPDGSGKSTLVDAISKRFKLPIGERGVADRDKLYEVTREDTHKALARAVLADEPPYVWDRLFFSDYVYAPVQGRKIAFTSAETYKVMEMLDLLGAPIFVCLPPLDQIKANLANDEKKQMSGVTENIHNIWHSYSRMFKPGGLFYRQEIIPCFWYDYTGEFTTREPGEPWNNDINGVFSVIEEYLEDRKDWRIWTPSTALT